MHDSRKEPRSFAEVALAGEDERRLQDAFARPARTKFWRHAALFLAGNVILAVANALVLPGHWLFYYVTIVWGAVLVDNFLWAYIVDPDRDVAERTALHAERDRRRAAAANGGTSQPAPAQTGAPTTEK